jgi:hypothetical protein
MRSPKRATTRATTDKVIVPIAVSHSGVRNRQSQDEDPSGTAGILSHALNSDAGWRLSPNAAPQSAGAVYCCPSRRDISGRFLFAGSDYQVAPFVHKNPAAIWMLFSSCFYMSTILTGRGTVRLSSSCRSRRILTAKVFARGNPPHCHGGAPRPKVA